MAVVPAPTRDAGTYSAGRFWIVPVLRAIVAVVIALIITFSADHSPTFGLVLFGALALCDGAIMLALAPSRIGSRLSGGARVQGLVGVLAGIAAFVTIFGMPTGRLGAFMLIVIIWAVLTGALELLAGFRSRGTAVPSRDLIFLGGLTLLLAIVFLFVPPELNVPYGGHEHVTGALTADILAVGLFGAYAAISGIYQAIGGLSLRWDNNDKAAAAATTTEAVS